MTNVPDNLANEPWTQIQKGMLTQLLASRLINQLMAEIKADVREMQAKGNYGDGQLSALGSMIKLIDRVLVRWKPAQQRGEDGRRRSAYVL